MMLRCPEGSVGNYEVRVEWITVNGDVDFSPRCLDLSPHVDVRDQSGILLEDSPRTAEDGTYSGELCHHEYELLRQLTGRGYFNGHRRHHLMEVSHGS